MLGAGLGAGLAGFGQAGPARASYLGSDGRIAFVRGGNIYTIEPGGTGQRKLTSDGADSGPRWSPDGKSQSQYLGGFPALEAGSHGATRLLDPDWYPIRTQFDRSLLATSEHCPAGHCTHRGFEVFFTAPVLPGAYQAVFSPRGDHIAYVRNVREVPHVYITVPGFTAPTGPGTLLTAGSEPDWQPVAPFPPS